MEQNEEILNEWGKSLENLEHLDYEEATTLYYSYILCDDEFIKSKLKNRLIEGTLYEVYKYIKDSLLPLLISSKYDMDDIISTCCETWIHLIDRGVLLEAHSFSKAISLGIYDKISNGLPIDQFDIGNSMAITKKELIELTHIYLNSSYLLNDDDYEKFIQDPKVKIFFHELQEPSSSSAFFDKYRVTTAYKLVRAIALILCPNGIAPQISKANIEKLIYVLVDAAIEANQVDLGCVSYKDSSNHVIDRIYTDGLLDAIDNVPFTPEEKQLLIDRLGLYEKDPLFYKELVAKYGGDDETIRRKIVKMISKIRSNDKFIDYTK